MPTKFYSAVWRICIYWQKLQDWRTVWLVDWQVNTLFPITTYCVRITKLRKQTLKLSTGLRLHVCLLFQLFLMNQFYIDCSIILKKIEFKYIFFKISYLIAVFSEKWFTLCICSYVPKRTQNLYITSLIRVWLLVLLAADDNSLKFLSFIILWYLKIISIIKKKISILLMLSCTL